MEVSILCLDLLTNILFRSVKTDSGNDACRTLGYDSAFVEIEDSVNAIVTKIDGLTKENGAGEFWSIGNTTNAW
jgi:norsolorinic acid ketoreductase